MHEDWSIVHHTWVTALDIDPDINVLIAIFEGGHIERVTIGQVQQQEEKAVVIADNDESSVIVLDSTEGAMPICPYIFPHIQLERSAQRQAVLGSIELFVARYSQMTAILEERGGPAIPLVITRRGTDPELALGCIYTYNGCVNFDLVFPDGHRDQFPLDCGGSWKVRALWR